MNRHQLDAFSARHALAPAAVAAALRLTGNVPAPSEWRRFFVRLLQAAGLAAVGAGVLFFVAANWQDYGVLGRFALLQAALLLCVGAALWRPPPQATGAGALLLATLLTGGLLALFGQSYQTGADVYELFLAWALLALPFALAGRSGALWATWWCILNVALALLCGFLGAEHVVWIRLGGARWGRAALLMLPCAINLLGALALLAVRRTRWADAAPDWLVRLLAVFGFGYGTVASLVAIAAPRYGPATEPPAGDTLALAVFAAISISVLAATLRARRDVFPLALLSASWIAIATAWLIKALTLGDAGAFLLVGLWLVVASTAASGLLMQRARAWQHGGGGDQGALP